MMTSAHCVDKRPSSHPMPLPQSAVGLHLRQNLLLAALSGDVLGLLGNQLSLVSLPAGLVVCESGCKQQYAYFPTSAIVSLFNITADGATTEVAEIGNNGLVGISTVLGGEADAHQLVVQSEGYALRIHASALKSEFERGGGASASVAPLHPGPARADRPVRRM